MFYEFNTGKLPFNGDEKELTRKIRNNPTPDLPIEFRQFSFFDKNLNNNFASVHIEYYLEKFCIC